MDELSAKTAARERIAILVRSFRRNEVDYLSSAYNETQARTDFITPLLAAFGWDVYNIAGHSSGLREVIEEATVEVGEGFSKRPDYELRLSRQRKLFVEAKKPSVAIDRSRDAAFQTRRYGYSASLPISVLTNFQQLAVYDCVPVPSETDEAHVARLLYVRYDEFDTRFEELWPLLSRHAIYSGDFDRRFSVGGTRQGAEQFDDFFLRQVRSWRERLASDIHTNTPELSPSELTYAVQLFLSRIIFLRICEDRDIERYENLKSLPNTHTFDSLLVELRRADKFYNSGLFRLLDDAPLGIRISDAVLLNIIGELYYPLSPYTFAVVETEVLGEIYEQFLGEEITITGGAVMITYKPEVRESGGVVPTPRYIVDAIVSRTLTPALAGKSPTDLIEFTVGDICCGSGIFLLGIYEFLLEHYLNWYLANQRDNHIGTTIYEIGAGNWRLTFDEKRRILQSHIRGVDIDSNAVEVAKLSILLKLIEHETREGLVNYVARRRERALPNLDGILRSGNSLISRTEWAAAIGTAIPEELIRKINPFDWQAEFPSEMQRGGFDVIVGNPPYIRIQNMMHYSPEEVQFYRLASLLYTTAQQDNFDKYALFFERALRLLRPTGRLGFITPHKFMSIQAGRALRRLLTAESLLETIVHFGVKQVFGRAASNYTCIIILDHCGSSDIKVEMVSSLEGWRYGEVGTVITQPAATLGEEVWQFSDDETRALFDRVRTLCPTRLKTVAEIFVGMQTSADDIYIFQSITETETHHILRRNGKDWPIEKGILRPFLKDVHLTAYSRPSANAWLIFPYEIIVIHGKTQARLLQPNEMEDRYPSCYAYLKAQREQLDKRGVAGGKLGERQFYQFGRSQSLVKFNSPKIILPALSLEQRYAYDFNNVVVTGGGNGPYYLIRQTGESSVTDHFLLAVLNHPLSEAIIRMNTSVFRGGYYSHGKQFIENLPIPIPSDRDRITVEALVTDLIAAQRRLETARTPSDRELYKRAISDLRVQVEGHISRLFGLTQQDVDIIRAVPIPS